MKIKQLRILVPILVGVIVAAAFIFHLNVGNLSAFGWEDIVLLCPLGAATTMLASQTIIPQAVISLVICLALMLVLGRLFCGWICPIPVIRKMPRLFKKKGSSDEDVALAKAKESSACAACKKNGASGCQEKRNAFLRNVDSRHIVLVGSLLSATIFGFPVFCLICPIGLSFATLFLIIGVFATGDITWGLVIVPVVLLLEVVFFKRWCSKICPLSAMMSLMGLANSKTLRPTVDKEKCIESKGVQCGRCNAVCEVDINPRHPELGTGFNECLKCRECVDVCPAKAITMPLIPQKQEHAKELEEK